LIKVVDRLRARSPGSEPVKRAVDLLRAAKKPLIVLGKGAAYAQADNEIRSLVEKTGIPYCRCRWRRACCRHARAMRLAARSFGCGRRRGDAIGARLNWLLSHGKAKTWGGKDHKDWGGQKFIPDRHLTAGGRQQRAHRCAVWSVTSARACRRCWQV